MKKCPVMCLRTILLLALVIPGCIPSNDEKELREFIDAHLKRVEPLMKAQYIADWNANATGEKKYYDESAALEFELRTIRSNPGEFAFLKELKEQGSIRDSLLQRELILLFNTYVKNQVDTALLRAITEKQAAIGLTFNTFRAMIDGKQVTDNDIRVLLSEERDVAKRKKAWEASKQVAEHVAPLLIELVNLRNNAATQMGFANFYELMLAADEQSAADIVKVFDELKTLTDEPYLRMKESLDTELATKFGVARSELLPWHYGDPFFQEPPAVGTIDCDALVRGRSIETLAERFYAGIELPADDILKRSDLYPRQGKYQHAYAVDIDRLGDVRTMCNIVDDMNWLGTSLHELGHCVYSKYTDRNLPFLLRTESHAFLTEGIAMLMERQAKNVDWLGQMVGIDERTRETLEKEVREDRRRQSLIFSRWAQVMMRFEKSMYEKPDQDLNSLWWNLVEEYQLLRRPEGRSRPDWAAKIHLAQYPCYYHNYMLGSLAASQILGSLNRSVVSRAATEEFSFVGKTDVGKFLKERIFRPGASLHWNELLRRATGEGLTAKYFAEQFCGNAP